MLTALVRPARWVAGQVTLKFLDRDRAVRVIGQQGGRDALHLAMQPPPFDQALLFHRFDFAVARLLIAV